MSKLLAGVSGLLARVTLLAIVVAVVIVPAAARSREQIEHRDATRLSIRHCWLGVAPPSKASVDPQPAIVMPAIVVDPAPRALQHGAAVVAPAPDSAIPFSLDPLRGPPAIRLS